MAVHQKKEVVVEVAVEHLKLPAVVEIGEFVRIALVAGLPAGRCHSDCSKSHHWRNVV